MNAQGVVRRNAFDNPQNASLFHGGSHYVDGVIDLGRDERFTLEAQVARRSRELCKAGDVGPLGVKDHDGCATGKRGAGITQEVEPAPIT